MTYWISIKLFNGSDLMHQHDHVYTELELAFSHGSGYIEGLCDAHDIAPNEHTERWYKSLDVRGETMPLAHAIASYILELTDDGRKGAILTIEARKGKVK